MRVHDTQSAEAAAAAKAQRASAAAQDAPKTSFAATLAKTSATPGTGGTTGSNTTPETTPPKDTALPKGPKGETTEPVKDHPYLEVMSGPRNGLFINTTNNVRRGQAFAMVHRADRDLHVYGTGKDRRVIISWHKDQPAHQNDAPAATDGTQSSSAATPNVGVATGTVK